jgi:hypothetical protein
MMKLSAADLMAFLAKAFYLTFALAFAAGIVFFSFLISHGSATHRDAFSAENVVECLHTVGPLLLVGACFGFLSLLGARGKKPDSEPGSSGKRENPNA